MQLGEHTAAVDNDFVDHLIASHLDDETFFAALNTVFEELGITAVMHPLVYENELMQDRSRTKELFRRGIVTKVEFADIFEDDSDRQAYYIFERNFSRSIKINANLPPSLVPCEGN